MRVVRHGDTRRNGAVAPFTAILLIVVMGFVAFAADLGSFPQLFERFRQILLLGQVLHALQEQRDIGRRLGARLGRTVAHQPQTAGDLRARGTQVGEVARQQVPARVRLPGRGDFRGGTLAPGFEADLIGLDGDPTADITALTRVAFVMKGGRIYKNIK